jgi:hypothetical protein
MNSNNINQISAKIKLIGLAEKVPNGYTPDPKEKEYIYQLNNLLRYSGHIAYDKEIESQKEEYLEKEPSKHTPEPFWYYFPSITILYYDKSKINKIVFSFLSIYLSLKLPNGIYSFIEVEVKLKRYSSYFSFGLFNSLGFYGSLEYKYFYEAVYCFLINSKNVLMGRPIESRHYILRERNMRRGLLNDSEEEPGISSGG